MVNNYGPQAHFGSFVDKQGRAREQARVFFYTAETWNRLVSYRIAWGEAWEKGLRPVDPQFNATVLRLADDYSFNMTGESAAFWQKGLLSIPTQFWAYNQRMFDAMFGKRFTAKQKARLIGMNLFMAGSAGVPGLQALSEYLKQQHGGSPDPDSIAAMADRGLIDYINYQATGADVIIGERLGTGGWASDVVKSMIGQTEYGNKSFLDLVGGATYSISKSTSKTLWNLGKYFVAEQGVEGGGEITKDNLVNLMKEISTFSQANKALIVHQYGMWKSNKGTILASDLPESHAIYAALSFRPAKADEISYLLAWSKNKEENLKEISTQMRNWRQEALVTGNYEKYWTKANTLMQMIPVEERREIIRRTNQIDEESFYNYIEEKVSEEQTEEQAMEDLE
jgi:DNA-binding Lrp family transcriptional regulator